MSKPGSRPAGHHHVPGSILHAWYGWTGWLPAPLRIVSFLVVAWLAARITLRYLVPPLARAGAQLANGALRVMVWLVIAPEYAITSALLRGGTLDLAAPFHYGETVAGLLTAGEGGVRQLSGGLEQTRKASGRLACCSVLAIVLLANLAAYRAHRVWPLATWWHSMETWARTLHHHHDRHHHHHKR